MKIKEQPKLNKWGIPTDEEQAARDIKRFLLKTIEYHRPILGDILKPKVESKPLAEKIGWQSGEDELRRHLEILTTPVNRGGVIVREIEYTSLEDVLAGTGRPYFGNITDQARAVVALFEYWNQAGHIPGLYSAGKKPRRNNTLMQCFDKAAGQPFASGSIRNLDPDPDRVKIYRDMLVE